MNADQPGSTPETDSAPELRLPPVTDTPFTLPWLEKQEHKSWIEAQTSKGGESHRMENWVASTIRLNEQFDYIEKNFPGVSQDELNPDQVTQLNAHIASLTPEFIVGAAQNIAQVNEEALTGANEEDKPSMIAAIDAAGRIVTKFEQEIERRKQASPMLK